MLCIMGNTRIHLLSISHVCEKNIMKCESVFLLSIIILILVTTDSFWWGRKGKVHHTKIQRDGADNRNKHRQARSGTGKGKLVGVLNS